MDILTDLEASDGERRFRVMVHLGEYALWLAGIFPEYIEARRLRRGGPDVPYYEALGRRGYGLASDHVLADVTGLEPVFRTRSSSSPRRCASAPTAKSAGPSGVSMTPAPSTT